MEVLFGLFEILAVAFEGCLGLAELVGLVFDAVAWFQSRDNRRQRREAKATDALPPRRTAWTWVFLFLTWSVVLLFAAAVYLAVAERAGWWPA